MTADLLKARVLTALLLAPLFVAAVLLLSTDALAALLAVVLLLAADEWAALGGLHRPWQRVAVVAWQASLLGAGWILLDRSDWLTGLLGLSVLGWVAVGAASVVRRAPVTPRPGPKPWLLAVAPMLAALAWVALVRLHGSGDRGPELVLGLLVVIWAADTGAYFAGRALGHRRLAPMVSPGKTLEGLVGGLLAAAVVGIGLHRLGLTAPAPAAAAVALSVVTAALSVAGDLFESHAKRAAGVKDSGRLLPGHGGVLDRIDSVLAGAPVFLLGILLVQGAAP
ncbi:MAG: phosphatidate cytidylyltransferase [Gammaproteobacteria bacterium]|jgi:phosphatidate cytidylyltransferase|nr:phosphatidate cytidylyltransferase [Gammaproteobacteria bacterium]